MSDPPTADVTRCSVPEDMKTWAKDNGLGDLEIHISDVAVSVEASVDKKPLMRLGEPARSSTMRDALMHLCRVVRESGRMAGAAVPIVMILDGTAWIEDDATYRGARKAVASMALDQEWHQGEVSLYLLPLVRPSHLKDPKDWKGPRDRDALRQALLGDGLDLREELPDVQTVGLDKAIGWLEGMAHDLAGSGDDDPTHHDQASAVSELAAALRGVRDDPGGGAERQEPADRVKARLDAWLRRARGGEA